MEIPEYSGSIYAWGSPEYSGDQFDFEFSIHFVLENSVSLS